LLRSHEVAIRKRRSECIRSGVDLGINVVHSSYEYKTIEQLGICLGKHPKRHELTHIIKVNSPDHGEARFDKHLFRNRIEEALITLHTDRIDVVQHLQRGISSEIAYHIEGDERRNSEFPVVLEELLDIFNQLKQEGKVGLLASFPYTTGYAKEAIKSAEFDALAAYYNPIEVEMADLFPDLQQQGMSLLAIRPLLAGLLTDRRADRSAIPDNDLLLSSMLAPSPSLYLGAYNNETRGVLWHPRSFVQWFLFASPFS
jgi:aryl-alcohol dehydrogenase-like predicted oxidoreductase